MRQFPHKVLFLSLMQQVNAAVSPPQYTTVTQNQNAQNNGTVYLTTDYITYRDYYTTPAASTVQTATSDQYQTVRQQLSASPAVTYTQAAAGNETTPAGDGQAGSFLDRYLRQPPVTSSTTNGATYKGTLHGGLTVDLPSPDSGIGEATVTPRAENGTLTQVCQRSISSPTFWEYFSLLLLFFGRRHVIIHDPGNFCAKLDSSPKTASIFFC